jgi:AcrR family transcriptional regulator
MAVAHNPGPRRRLSPEARREQIVEAAVVLFAERDPAVLTLEEIADGAGVSRALVYNYFGDRNGLLEAVYERSVSRLNDEVTLALSSTRGLRDALRAAVSVHVRVAVADPALYRHAAGRTPFPRLGELELARVEHLAQDYGASPAARLMARGVVSSIHDMVAFWLDEGGVEADDCVDIVHAFLWGALTGVNRLGLTFRPPWPVPAAPVAIGG